MWSSKNVENEYSFVYFERIYKYSVYSFQLYRKIVLARPVVLNSFQSSGLKNSISKFSILFVFTRHEVPSLSKQQPRYAS